MKIRIRTKNWRDPESWVDLVELVPRPPARLALDANLVTEADLLRLKVIARLQARGLPPHIGWSDLLQEAFARILDGSRRRPDGLPMVAFVAGVMRSIREQFWRQARRGARHRPSFLAQLEIAGVHDGEPVDPHANPERRAIANQEVEAILALFEDDRQARQVISALYEDLTAEETCATYAMSRTDYESTRKRIRRALIKAGLRTPQL